MSPSAPQLSLSEFSFGERWLVDGVENDQLQAHPWGERVVWVDIPGGPFELAGLSDVQVDVLDGAFGAASGPPLDSATLRTPKTTVLRDDDRIFKIDFSEVRVIDADLRVSGKTFRIVGPDFVGRADLESGEGLLMTFQADSGGFLGTVLNYIRPLAAMELIQQRRLMLHSGAVVVDGAALVFFGHSGSGKSTSSRLALEAGHRVVSDDLNVLSLEGSKLMVEAFPQAGELRAQQSSGRFPVRGLYRLRQGDQHSVEPFGKARAVATLIASAPFLNQSLESEELLVEVVSEMVGRVDVGRLTFRKDVGFLDLLTRDSID